MQFQVPQFIDTEDKVVGPFSIRQFIYVGIAAFVSALFYFVVQTWLFVIVAIILVGGALAISFIKVEGRSLSDVIMAGARYYWRPQTYVWQPEHHASPVKKAQKKKFSLEEMAAEMALRKKWEEDQKNKNKGTLETISQASPLRKTWEEVQTGTPLGKKISDRQLVERKMAERYQIYQKVSGERKAARRIDYR